MKRFWRYGLALGALPFLLACGAVATMPEDQDSVNLSNPEQAAIWHTNEMEVGHLVEPITDGFETGFRIAPSLEKEIRGTFLLTLPEGEPLVFSMQADMVSGESELSIYVQVGNQFHKIKKAILSSQTQNFRVDVSSYQGQTIFLTLVLQSEKGIGDVVFLRSPQIQSSNL